MQSKVLEKLKKDANYERMGLFEKHGDYYYFSHNTGLQNQSVHYRISNKISIKTDQKEILKQAEVFMDVNKMSEDGSAKVPMDD